MENNFHDINEYHSFVTKQMFLSEPETTMSISSEQNESYLIKSKMSDKEWCVEEHETMPKELLTYSYLVSNDLEKMSK